MLSEADVHHLGIGNLKSFPITAAKHLINYYQFIKKTNNSRVIPYDYFHLDVDGAARFSHVGWVGGLR